jgi:hypothetical protein
MQSANGAILNHFALVLCVMRNCMKNILSVQFSLCSSKTLNMVSCGDARMCGVGGPATSGAPRRGQHAPRRGRPHLAARLVRKGLVSPFSLS